MIKYHIEFVSALRHKKTLQRGVDTHYIPAEIHVYEEYCKQIIQVVESNFARWLLSWWSNVLSFPFGNQVCSIDVYCCRTQHKH